VQERELFRIAQEGLNNVVKHAAASRATLRLRATPTAIMLLIEDDGKGFDPALPPRADAFGTRGMQERAALLGGEVAFDSRPGGGTRVLVTIPRTGTTAPLALDDYRQGTHDATVATGGD
jgi:signal transduction histidine kinase